MTNPQSLEEKIADIIWNQYGEAMKAMETAREMLPLISEEVNKARIEELEKQMSAIIGETEIEVHHTCQTDVTERLAHYTEGWNDKIKSIKARLEEGEQK